MSVIKITSLSKHFGSTKAVDDISFEVKKGEVIGFVGPNGAGKTTTIGMMLGFLRPTRGEISILGQIVDPANAHKLHSRIGYVAGDMELFDSLTGQQYLSLLRSLVGRDKNQFDNLIKRLQPVLNKPLKKLSRGNKQKVALVGALQHNPELIIFDEPTSGLDPLMQETFLDLIKERSEQGTTVFMSSHILSEVAKACDRVLFMKDGQVIENTSVSSIEKQAGKQIIIEAKADIIKQLQTKAPAGLELLSNKDNQLTYQLKNDNINPILNWLSDYKLDDVDIHERELDDIFRHLYTTEKPAEKKS